MHGLVGASFTLVTGELVIPTLRRLRCSAGADEILLEKTIVVFQLPKSSP
jgi:hypothetical protein